ncbi:AAA-ATPase-like domain-containing protein [Plasmodiophora brassicae]
MMVSAALLQRCRRPSALVRCMQASATTVTADVSNFRTLRESNLTYVDKTGEIDDLLSFDRSFVLCRPPRFGKTVMLTLLKELFEGNRQLFDGTVGPRLAIADAPWDWDDEQHTVLHFDLKHLANAKSFRANLFAAMDAKATALGRKLPETTSLKSKTRDLIQAAADHSPSQQCVVLVDNYDSPLRVNDLAISDTDDKILPMNHRVVDDWLDGIRAEQACVRFQMFVGVYKVESTAVSIANDISLATQCSTLCGYTRQDIETAFPLELDHLVALNQASSRDTLLDRIGAWYGGYSWGQTAASDRIHNPFSVNRLMMESAFEPYWSQETAVSPSLVHMLHDVDLRDMLSSLFVLPEVFNNELPKFTSKRDVLTDRLRMKLLQLGLLTVEETEYTVQTLQRVARLGVPNKDVEQILRIPPVVAEKSQAGIHP